MHRRAVVPGACSAEYVFAENGHHTIRMEDGTDSDWMDQDWMSAIEAEIPKAVDALVEGSRPLRTIGHSDRVGIAMFINLLWYTIPKQIRRSMEMTPRSAREAAFFADWKAAHSAPPPDPEALRQFALGRAVQLVFERSPDIANRAWQLLRVDPSSSTSLVLSDDPVLDYSLPAKDGDAYTVMAIPLDPRVLLVIYPFDQPDLPDGELKETDVRLANRRAWAQSDNAVVGLTTADLDHASLSRTPMLPGAIRDMLVARVPRLYGR